MNHTVFYGAVQVYLMTKVVDIMKASDSDELVESLAKKMLYDSIQILAVLNKHLGDYEHECVQARDLLVELSNEVMTCPELSVMKYRYRY